MRLSALSPDSVHNPRERLSIHMTRLRCQKFLKARARCAETQRNYVPLSRPLVSGVHGGKHVCSRVEEQAVAAREGTLKGNQLVRLMLCFAVPGGAIPRASLSHCMQRLRRCETQKHRVLRM
jgi:hypothetical protein